MEYDLDNPEEGVRECPKCRHTMQYLKAYNSVRYNEGYMIDDGRDRTNAVAFWFGTYAALLYRFYRYVAQPFSDKKTGERKQRRLDRILKAYPKSLICLHCHFIWKRR